MIMEQNMPLFIPTQKQKQILMKVTAKIYFNQSIRQLYEIYKYILENVQVGLLIQF